MVVTGIGTVVMLISYVTMVVIRVNFLKGGCSCDDDEVFLMVVQL